MIATTYYNRIKSHKKFLAVGFCFLFFTYIIFATPYFSGTMGIGSQFQPVQDEKPNLLMDSYFAGQFDLSNNLLLRTGLSIYTTESIIKESFFQNTPAIFSLDEISLTYRGSVGELSHFLGIYMGEYDPVGSDIFLQRQFGIPSFSSRLTESICGDSRAKIYEMSGIGGTYLIKLPQNLTFGANLYYNKVKDFTLSTSTKIEDTLSQIESDTTKDSFIESLNVDLRFAGAWNTAVLDFAVGLTMPMKKEIVLDDGNSQDVILLIERADMHAGFTAFLGSSNSSSLLFQAGFSKLIIDPTKVKDDKVLSFDDVYILVEPRFVSKNMNLSLSLFNMPASTRENLFHVKDPVGVSISLYSPWLSLSGNKSQFGLMTTISSSKTLENIIIDNKTTTDEDTKLFGDLNLFISPYGTIHMGAGKLNFSLNVNALDIKDFDSFFSNVSIIAGYKVLLW